MARALTATHLSILRHIINALTTTGVSPSLAELAAELGLTHGAISFHIDALHKKKLVLRKQNRPRSLRLTLQGMAAVQAYEDVPALKTGTQRLIAMPPELANSRGAA